MRAWSRSRRDAVDGRVQWLNLRDRRRLMYFRRLPQMADFTTSRQTRRHSSRITIRKPRRRVAPTLESFEARLLLSGSATKLLPYHGSPSTVYIGHEFAQ